MASMRTCTTCNQKYEIGDTRVFAVSGHGVQERDDRSLNVSEHRSSATRLHVDVVGSHPPLSAKQKDLDSWYHHGMSAYQTDSRIDDYIQTLPGWQQEMCRQVRDLVHAADPEVTETIKRTRQPYFVLHGNICALLAAKDHVNVFLYDGGIVPDPDGIITGGHGNKTARTVAIRQGEAVNAPALGAMFRQIIANNRAGGC